MITSSIELQRLLDGKDTLPPSQTLAPGEYHVHGMDVYRELDLTGASRYGSVVHVHEAPLKVGHVSHISNLTFHAAPDTPAVMLLDHSSRAQIFDNFLNAPTAWDHRGDIAAFERQSVGILTTDDSNSEDNWNVQIFGNEFRWFKAGIETRTPGISPVGNRLKGTSRWLIANNGFDGCEYGLHLTRPEMFNIEWNHFQLHRVGIELRGAHTNWLTNNDFERGYGEFDIAYDDNTCYTLAVGNTPRVERVSAEVKNAKRGNVYARPLRKLNLWADCSKGEE